MILYQPENSLKPYNYDAKEYHDFRYSPHLHRDLEIVYPLSGQIRMTVEGNTTSLSAGELALILPNQIHSFETPGSSLVLVLVFSADFVPQFSACIKENKWKGNRFTLSAADKSFVFEKLMGDEPPERLLLSSCLQILCAAYWQSVKDQPPLSSTPSRSATLLHRMLEYVALHYTEDITLRERYWAMRSIICPAASTTASP